LGAGWPKDTDSAAKSAGELEEAQATTVSQARQKVEEAKTTQLEQAQQLMNANGEASEDTKARHNSEDPSDLGYCTVWVGKTEEREHTDSSTSPPPKVATPAEEWQLMEPNAGITLVYFPFLSNPKVEGVDPAKSPYMSTWNFVYKPDDIDHVIALARTNFEEGRERTRRTVRAVYERKKKLREQKEDAVRLQRWRERVRHGIINVGEGDHFS